MYFGLRSQRSIYVQIQSNRPLKNLQDCFKPILCFNLFLFVGSIIKNYMSKENQQVASKLIKITLLSLLFMTVEFVGGHLAHSIAIWSDAFHLLSDVLAYAISLVAVLLSQRKSPGYLTFGWVKAQTLGALFNVIFIYIVTIQLFIEATHRMIKKDKVEDPVYMLITSIFGLICNLIVLSILHSDPNAGHHGCSHDHGSHSHLQAQTHQHHHHGAPCSSHHKTMIDNPKQNSLFAEQQMKDTHIHEHQNHSSHCDHHAQGSSHKHHAQRFCGLQLHHQHQNHKQSPEHQHNHSHSQKGCCGSQMKKTKQNQGQRDSGDEIVPESDNRLKKVQLLMQSQILPTIGSEQDLKDHKTQQGKTRNINLQAAYIHILTDIILSIGVIIAALIIYFFVKEGEQWSPWHLADPLCTYLFSFLAIYSTWPILKQSLLILLDGCEDAHLLEKIQRDLKQVKEIKQIVQLKLWTLNRGKHCAAVKVRMEKDFGSWRVRRVFTLRGVQCFVEVQPEQRELNQ